jgi:glycosyltransferase involved in cell wall biosynthesis
MRSFNHARRPRRFAQSCGEVQAPPRRVAFIGNSLPRRCGIATFTTDLQQAVAADGAAYDTAIVAMTDEGRDYQYPPIVRHQVQEGSLGEYARAARFLNAEAFDVVCLQHEFGIFGGESGGHIMTLLNGLRMPIVTTFHTVLAQPDPIQRHLLREIAEVSANVIVMAEKGRQLLQCEYGVPPAKIVMIPHGIPDCAFVEPDAAKLARGFSGRSVILTFGLISPNKGLEIMIEAMPAILRTCPDAVYVVLGATHPHLIRSEGEAYRESLKKRTRELGVETNVVFLDQFVDRVALLDFISMCDVYVTPYLNEAQMTSGTLAYSFGVGKAVVSTPYWHARELLAESRGVLVPFGDSAAIGSEIAALLTDDRRRQALRRVAYQHSRSMTWERTAKRYLAVFESVIDQPSTSVIRERDANLPKPDPLAPQLCLSHFLAMCDDTGLLQHAVYCVPDRSHGYCVDDNARALLLACALTSAGEACLDETITSGFAALLQDAWNPRTQRFRNFMSFERRWLEESGSEDSHGRALWALGVCARDAVNLSRRRWAAALFSEAAPSVAAFKSPRAWAFTLLGLDAFCFSFPQDMRALELKRLLGARLMSILGSVETPDWVWFEEGLAYDNARLPQALIVTGDSLALPDYRSAGLRALSWIMALQTAGNGFFRPVGSHSFGDLHRPPLPFDQQPLEATASISACLAAGRIDGDPKWKAHAIRAFEWFQGANDLDTPLVDPDTGSCCDGLHPDRVNENRGGESVVSYLLSVTEMRNLECRADTVANLVPLRAHHNRVH